MSAVSLARPGEPDAHVVSRRLAAASDERRRGIERILHDGVQQHLALLGLKLSMLKKLINTDTAAAEAMCAELHREHQEVLRELRSVTHLIYPAILDNEGLAAALRHAAARLGIRTSIEVDQEAALPAGFNAAFYFCCLEALDNVARHAGPDVHVVVRARTTSSEATFEVVDDGAGFRPEALLEPSGLQHIADRIEALDGRLEVDSSEKGTRVRATVPLPAAD
jgi:signal transduction histidine kinase